MTMSIIPTRKGRSTAGAGGGSLEEAWLVVEAPPAKKSHAIRASPASGHEATSTRSCCWRSCCSSSSPPRSPQTTAAPSRTRRRPPCRVLPMPPALATTPPPRAGATCRPGGGCTTPRRTRCTGKARASSCRIRRRARSSGGRISCTSTGNGSRTAAIFQGSMRARLLQKLRDKRLVFFGDSLNQNQWVSMVCLIDTATPPLHKSMANNGSLISFKIHEYNTSVDFYWSPLLVESNSDHPVHHRLADRVVRAGSIAKHATRWADADVLVFNSYLWWRRPDIKVLRRSFEPAAESEHRAAFEVTDGLRAFELAIRTWSEWLELHVDRARTKLFFTSMLPTHLNSDEWDGGGNHQCYNETEPIAAEAAVARLGQRGVAVRVVNVTQLSEHRKDAHPSVHRRQWSPPTAEEMEARARDPSSGADCIRWCLPGVPDVWNLMLYAHIVPS